MNRSTVGWLRDELARYEARLEDVRRQMDTHHERLSELERERLVIADVVARLRAHLPADQDPQPEPIVRPLGAERSVA